MPLNWAQRIDPIHSLRYPVLCTQRGLALVCRWSLFRWSRCLRLRRVRFRSSLFSWSPYYTLTIRAPYGIDIGHNCYTKLKRDTILTHAMNHGPSTSDSPALWRMYCFAFPPSAFRAHTCVYVARVKVIASRRFLTICMSSDSPYTYQAPLQWRHDLSCNL